MLKPLCGSLQMFDIWQQFNCAGWLLTDPVKSDGIHWPQRVFSSNNISKCHCYWLKSARCLSNAGHDEDDDGGR